MGCCGNYQSVHHWCPPQGRIELRYVDLGSLYRAWEIQLSVDLFSLYYVSSDLIGVMCGCMIQGPATRCRVSHSAWECNRCWTHGYGYCVQWCFPLLRSKRQHLNGLTLAEKRFLEALKAVSSCDSGNSTPHLSTAVGSSFFPTYIRDRANGLDIARIPEMGIRAHRHEDPEWSSCERCVMSCYARLCRRNVWCDIILLFVVFCSVRSCCVTVCYATLHYVMLCYQMKCSDLLCFVCVAL